MIADPPGQIVGFPTSTIFAWPVAQMRDVCKLNYGKALKAETRRAGTVPVYGSNGPTGWHDEALASGPTVILGRKGQGNLGVEWRDGPFWVIDTAYFVTFSEKVDPRFFYFFVDFVGLNHLKDGTSNPSLSRDTFYLQPIPLPPLHDQRSIARCLAAFDDKIEINRRMNEALEATAQAIFRDWFIDFGPVRRKRAGATDPVKIMGGMTCDSSLAAILADLFPDEFGDDDLPYGWTLSTVGASFNLTMGQSPPGETYNESGEGLPFFQGRTDFGFRFPVRRKHCSQPTRVAQPDDTLISVRAPVGDLNMAWEACCIGRGVAAARHKSGGPSYTYYAMLALQPELEQFEHTGTVFGAINKQQFERLAVVEPDRRLVSAFEDLAGPIDARIRASVSETGTLSATRDYLLPRLMSGEVRVAETEEHLEAVA